MSLKATFACGVCFDTQPLSERVSVTAEDNICTACFEEGIKPLFLATMEHEHAYSVKWGNATLEAERFAAFLLAGFVLRWIWRKREYGTTVKGRVYCRHHHHGEGSSDGGECGRFLGAVSAAFKTSITCLDCKGTTCTCYTCPFSGVLKDHFCGHDTTGSTTPTSATESADPFGGMKRGTDYQLCPSCNMPVTLRDGCSQLVCVQTGCGMNFCYICGSKISRKEGEHFVAGKPCPRYNQPGASNAHRDTPDGPNFAGIFARSPTPLPNARPTQSITIPDALDGPLLNSAQQGLRVHPEIVRFQAMLQLVRTLPLGVRAQRTMLSQQTGGRAVLDSKWETYLQHHVVLEESSSGLQQLEFLPAV